MAGLRTDCQAAHPRAHETATLRSGRRVSAAEFPHRSTDKPLRCQAARRTGHKLQHFCARGKDVRPANPKVVLVRPVILRFSQVGINQILFSSLIAESVAVGPRVKVVQSCGSRRRSLPVSIDAKCDREAPPPPHFRVLSQKPNFQHNPSENKRRICHLRSGICSHRRHAGACSRVVNRR
jgi:hypothetical protein